MDGKKELQVEGEVCRRESDPVQDPYPLGDVCCIYRTIIYVGQNYDVLYVTKVGVYLNTNFQVRWVFTDFSLHLPSVSYVPTSPREEASTTGRTSDQPGRESPSGRSHVWVRVRVSYVCISTLPYMYLFPRVSVLPHFPNTPLSKMEPENKRLS